jgi:hypothetical protein
MVTVQRRAVFLLKWRETDPTASRAFFLQKTRCPLLPKFTLFSLLPKATPPVNSLLYQKTYNLGHAKVFWSSKFAYNWYHITLPSDKGIDNRARQLSISEAR